MRIAIAGIAVEACTFSPLPTRLADFRVWEGQALLDRFAFLDVGADVELVPILYARALPGGAVEASAYHQLKAHILDELASDRWDGVYLALHGAMFVQGMQDAEGDFVTAVRQLVGADCVIGASYDLHGNVSARVVEQLDLLTAYRTAPHIDEPETCQRAVSLLVEVLREGHKPAKAFIPIPTLLPGEQATATDDPGKGLYAMLPDLIREYDLLDASILIGYAWADEARVGSSVVVYGRDAIRTRLAAQNLAQAFWDARHDFVFPNQTGTVEECLQLAVSAPEQPFFISDAGDNVTGGGVGDVPLMLQQALAHGLQNALYASLVDAEAVAACFAAGVGQQVDVSLGGKLDIRHGHRLSVSGTVQTLLDDANNPQAVLAVEGVQVILTSQRTAFTEVAQFSALGLELTTFKTVIIKLGYLFPQLQPIAARSVLAFSPGAINPQVTALDYQALARPAFPLDAEMVWSPQVRVWG